MYDVAIPLFFRGPVNLSGTNPLLSDGENWVNNKPLIEIINYINRLLEYHNL